MWLHLGRWIQRWLRGDRIRASPRDGEILRLLPGSILCIRGEMLKVVHRAVVGLAANAIVEYDCVSVAGECRIRVDANEPLHATLVRSHGETRVSLSELEVFATAVSGPGFSPHRHRDTERRQEE